MGNGLFGRCCVKDSSCRPEWEGRDDESFLATMDLDLQNIRGWVASNEQGEDAPSKQDEFVFFSWNILADGKWYAVSEKHAYCPLKHRLWDVRLKKIVSEIKQSGADIVALQEPTDEMWPSIKESLGELYDGCFESRGIGVCSVGMLWKRERFARLEERLLHYKTMVMTRPETKLWTKILNANSSKIGIAILLCDRRMGKMVIASSSHLYWNPREPDRKLGELFLHCEALAKLEREWQNKYKYEEGIPVVIGIDSNSTPRKSKPDNFDTSIPPEGLVSGVYQLATTGRVEETHPHHPNMTIGDEVTPALTLTTPFNSAYRDILGDEPLWTTKSDDFAGTLDYIFHRGPVRVSQVLELPYKNAREAKRSNRIPSEQFPSDHLSLAARFNWVRKK